MLKHNTVRIAIYLAVLIILAARWIGGMDVIFLLPVVFLVYLGFISWGAYFIDSGFFLDAYCKAETKDKIIALTFDDGPVRSVTPEVLDLLKRYQAKATFFCIGKNLAGNEDIIRRMSDEGHEIGNHSWSHSYFFDFFRDGKVESELIMTNEALKSITGKDVKYFRPPFGVTNPVIARVVDKLNMPVIGWSIRSMDTTIANPDQLYNRVIRKLQPGDIILFHDSLERILPVLEKFLVHAKQQGFEVVGLDKLLKQ